MQSPAPAVQTPGDAEARSTLIPHRSSDAAPTIGPDVVHLIDSFETLPFRRFADSRMDVFRSIPAPYPRLVGPGRVASGAHTRVSTHLARRTVFRRRSPTCNRPSPLWPDGGRWAAKGGARVACVQPRAAPLSPSRDAGAGPRADYRSMTTWLDAVLSPRGGPMGSRSKQELDGLGIPNARTARICTFG